MRMVTLLTHTRGDALLKPGVEFDATEEEAHAYAARANPLAGPLEDDEPPAPAKEPKRTKRTVQPTPATATAKKAAEKQATEKKPGRKGRKA